MYKMKIFFGKIIKIFQYLPLLWKDEDWDFQYLLDLIEFKLKRIKKCIRQNNIIVEHEINEIEQGINKTLDAINKYNDDITFFPMLDPEELFNVEMFWKRNDDRNTSSMCYRFFDGKEVPKDHEFFKYQTKFITRRYYWQQACWNRIFDTMKKNAQKWWD